jgi:hypothetical protein
VAERGTRKVKSITIMIDEEKGFTIEHPNLTNMEVYGWLDFIKRMMFIRLGKTKEQSRDERPSMGAATSCI